MLRGRALLVVLVAAGCRDVSEVPADAELPDARIVPPPGCYVDERVSCLTGNAALGWQFYSAPIPFHACTPPTPTPSPYTTTATCAGGCALEIEGDRDIGSLSRTVIIVNARSLCADTPEAQVGDTCDGIDQECLPTRAHVAADGTVTDQQYLRCDDGTSTCVGGSAPVFKDGNGQPFYLTRCAAATLTQYGIDGVNGTVLTGRYDVPGRYAACLLAWDSTTQAVASGLTATCYGDWECPAGALCDGSVNLIAPAGMHVAVCKPGPRGTLTPAMLSP